MKLYFKPILLASGSTGGQGSVGEEGGETFDRRRAVNLLGELDSVDLTKDEVIGLDLDGLSIEDSAPVGVASPEPIPEVETVLDAIVPADPVGE